MRLHSQDNTSLKLSFSFTNVHHKKKKLNIKIFFFDLFVIMVLKFNLKGKSYIFQIIK